MSPPLTRTMRVLLIAAAILVVGAGAPLVLAPDRTERLFAFSIDPPVSAAFLGANFWAAAFIEALSATRRRWVDARAALPGIALFATLTAVVSLFNLGQFEAGLPSWIWLGVYILFPPAALAAWLVQRRAGGADPERTALPPALRALYGLLGIVLGPLGLALVLYPVQAGAVWAWELTPPTASYRSASGTSLEPYVGCWLVGMAAVAAGAVVENDARRIRPIAVGLVALGVLQAFTIARFRAEIEWARPGAWGLAAGVVVFGFTGVWTLARGRRGLGGEDWRARTGGRGRGEGSDGREGRGRGL